MSVGYSIGMKVTRRHVLAAAAAVPAAAALGAGGLALRWYDKPPGSGLSILSDDEYAFTQAFAEAWMPPGGTPALSVADADLGRWFDELLGSMAPTQQTLLKVLLQALDDMPVLTDGSRFVSLALERRTELVARWSTSNNAMFRAAISGLIVLLGMGWTTHPDVAPGLAHMFRCGWSR